MSKFLKWIPNCISFVDSIIHISGKDSWIYLEVLYLGYINTEYGKSLFKFNLQKSGLVFEFLFFTIIDKEFNNE